jgi:hypothetical protein
MTGPVDPRELTAGYAFANRSLGTAWGVLRDGRTEVWRCRTLPGHRVHPVPGQAHQCAARELERRVQGAQEVLQALHCRPCGIFWDLGWLSQHRPAEPPEHDIGHWLLRGACPRCEVPAGRVRIAVLERQEASVR